MVCVLLHPYYIYYGSRIKIRPYSGIMILMFKHQTFQCFFYCAAYVFISKEWYKMVKWFIKGKTVYSKSNQEMTW